MAIDRIESINKIERTAKKFNVDKQLLERHVRALELAREIQKFKNDFVLFGGTAVQFYLLTKLQRTSVDVDLITNHSPDETTKIMKEFCEQSPSYKGVKSTNMKQTYGQRYLFPVNLKYGGNVPDYVKVEIVSRVNDDLKHQKKENCKIYDLGFGNFEILIMEDLFAKKIATLDIGNVGMVRDREDLGKQMGKQIYDLKRLYDLLREKEFSNIGGYVYEHFKNEIRYKRKKCSPDDCIHNVCRFMSFLGIVDTRKSGGYLNRLRDGCKIVNGHFLPKSARLQRHEWSAFGWDFEHLLKSIEIDQKNSNNEKTLRHFELREKYRQNGKMYSDERKNCFDVFKQHEFRGQFRQKPLSSLIFKKELLEGLDQ